MNKTTLAFLDGLFLGIIAAISMLSGALLELPKDAGVGDISSITWLITGLALVGGAVKGWHGYVKEAAHHELDH